MKSHARVVVIGGGVVGCSVLYHLTKFGWTDVVLVERSELTSGSTWHAAGGMHTINGDPNVAKLQKYTVELYKEIEEYSGQDIGLHMTSGLMLAATNERFDWMKSLLAKGKYAGGEATLISSREAYEMMPLLDPDQFVGAVFDPHEGHLDPYGTTHAYAKSAKKNGADIYLHTKVEDLVQREDGSWRVITNKGEIIAEHVVNCGGLWAREVGRMVGLELPVLAMEHMYLITEDMPEVIEFNKTSGKELMHCVDFDGEIYIRQERNGMLMGTYEKACRPWSPIQTPWDFGHELLAEDLERISSELEVGFRHFPAFNNAGIKKIINGPFTFSPDGNPLVGPVRGMTNFWSACAVMAGFSQGGGVGLALANWMIHGDPGFDVFAMDVCRYGDFATLGYTNAKVRENYSRRFSIRYPNEELPGARPFLTTPIYERLKAEGAVFGASYGLEQPLWFAPEGVEDAFSWRRSTDFETVGAEAKAVRDSVGLMETSGFAKYTITGKGASAWLDRLLAARIPTPGRMVLAPMLKDDGKLIGDFTLACLGQDDFLLIGSGIAEDYHMRWFESHLPDDGSVSLKPLNAGIVGLSIAGPNSRALIEKLTHLDMSDAAFPFMAIRKMDLGMAPAIVGRVSYTGDLGYEIWMKPEYQRYLFDLLMETGKEFGIRLFGLRALNALRLEKSFGSWSREYRPLYGPLEAGLSRFVALSKEADFIGKAAAQKEKAEGGELRLRTFVVEAGDADVIGDEPISLNGKVCGWVTSGGYAHAAGVSVAIGYVPKEVADEADGWSVEILGEHLPARLQVQPLFDANGSRMRS
ncbi:MULTISPECIES: FAD-dependent oxidoreductase [unclassified Rhizobium]|uniref:GcvT family protein n=1 Tax=unclassified Rhizobium TaxID=2613769 RepID=UPI0007020087|nr:MULTISPECIES: FAD-dependent oxidoreductase [unclassified Rhizobium]KQV38125.1 glycine cleavage system protein T [Rhizobium sp. Root1212]KRD30782.1 glycine cleavage system protein T [Rhizobium sp. Root268]